MTRVKILFIIFFLKRFELIFDTGMVFPLLQFQTETSGRSAARTLPRGISAVVVHREPAAGAARQTAQGGAAALAACCRIAQPVGCR